MLRQKYLVAPTQSAKPWPSPLIRIRDFRAVPSYPRGSLYPNTVNFGLEKLDVPVCIYYLHIYICTCLCLYMRARLHTCMYEEFEGSVYDAWVLGPSDYGKGILGNACSRRPALTVRLPGFMCLAAAAQSFSWLAVKGLSFNRCHKDYFWVSEALR